MPDSGIQGEPEKPFFKQEEMFLYREEVDMFTWYKTPDPTFASINKKSRVPQEWKSFQRVLRGTYGNEIIKPINYYAEFMCDNPPELVSIEGNTVRLRQYSYAQIYVLDPNDFDSYTQFNATDRPWIRQFYNTRFKFEAPDTCFEPTYLLYTPWIIDANVDVTYEPCKDIESPFYIYPITGSYKYIQDRDFVDELEPHWIPFHFKRVGSHIQDDLEFGMINENSPMYDIVFTADDIIIRDIKEFYERH